MSKATLIKNGQKVVVESGSQDAQNYFGQGYSLMPAEAPITAPQTGMGVFQANKAIIPVINNPTLNMGTNSPIIPLGNSNTEAQTAINDNLIKDATDQSKIYQNEAEKIKLANLQQLEKEKVTAQQDLTKVQGERDTAISDYDTANKGLVDTARSEYGRMLGSLEQINYDSLVKDRLSATNDIISYSKLMNDELAQEASRPALASVKQGREQNVKDTYTSKIATSQAVLQAIDGNFTLAFDIMDKGANAINQNTADRINFLNSVSTIYGDKITSAEKKLTTITADEKKAIEQTIADLEAKQKNVDDSKTEIMKLMETNPVIAQKANLLLTDTPEQRATKLNDFYTKNPQYTEDNQAYIKSMREKYFDAGITMNDSLATVESKVKNSVTYKNETAKTPKVEKIGTDKNGNDIYATYDPATNSSIPIGTTDVASGIVGGYNIKSYATDPTHEQKVANILTNIGKFNTVQDVDNYIGSKYPNSPITGQMIAETSQKFGVSWEMLVAMMEQDSSLGTAGKGARTFNPGNVGNDDSGNIRNYGNWQSGVDAVGQWLGNNKVAETQSDTPTLNKIAQDWAVNIRDGKSKISDITSEVEKENPGLKNEVNSILVTLPPSKAQIDETQKLVDRLKELRDHSGLNSSVGPTGISRMAWWDVFGNKDGFLGKADTVISKKALDSLISAKSQGATFGALSEREMGILKSAGTTLGAWSNEKDGKLSGFDVSQTEFKTELDNMIKEYENLLLEAGTVQSLDSYLKANPNKISEYNAIVANNPNLNDDEVFQALNAQ